MKQVFERADPVTVAFDVAYNLSIAMETAFYSGSRRGKGLVVGLLFEFVV
jgi:hypothetical protein